MILLIIICILSFFSILSSIAISHYYQKNATEKSQIFNTLLMYGCLAFMNLSFPATLAFDILVLRNNPQISTWDARYGSGWFYQVNTFIGTTFILACIGAALQLWFKFIDQNFLVFLRPLLVHMNKERMHHSIPRIILLLLIVTEIIIAAVCWRDSFRGVIFDLIIMCSALLVFGVLQVFLVLDFGGMMINEYKYIAAAGTNKRSFFLSFLMGSMGAFFPAIVLFMGISQDPNLTSWYSSEFPQEMKEIYNPNAGIDIFFIFPAISGVVTALPFLRNKKFKSLIYSDFSNLCRRLFSMSMVRKSHSKKMETNPWISTIADPKIVATKSLGFNDVSRFDATTQGDTDPVQKLPANLTSNNID